MVFTSKPGGHRDGEGDHSRAYLAVTGTEKVITHDSSDPVIDVSLMNEKTLFRRLNQFTPFFKTHKNISFRKDHSC